MGRGSWTALLVVAACGGGATASFRAGAGYAPRPRDGVIEVFLHQIPERPYDAVGLITVDRAGAPQQALDEAVAVARRAGCELLVTRSLLRELGLAGGRLVAQAGGSLGSPRGGVIGGGERERRRDELVCGVWRAAP